VCSAVEYFNTETTNVPQKPRTGAAQLLSSDCIVLTPNRVLWFQTAEVNDATRNDQVTRCRQSMALGKWEYYPQPMRGIRVELP